MNLCKTRLRKTTLRRSGLPLRKAYLDQKSEGYSEQAQSIRKFASRFSLRVQELNLDAQEEGTIAMAPGASTRLIRVAIHIGLQFRRAPLPSIFLRTDGSGVLSYSNKAQGRRINIIFPDSQRSKFQFSVVEKAEVLSSGYAQIGQLVEHMKWLTSSQT
jgi:hypothetical protein